MRFIAACPQCQVQYWSDETEPQQKIHCYCGTVIALRISEGKSARVVRCSSCGAPREKQASACRFCHSDFTIHEKDLNTVCPQCMARISDAARFCHHCGVKISPQFASGKVSGMACPACAGSRPLHFRKEAEQLPFFECHICAGIWLSMDTFSEVVQKSKSEEIPVLLKKFSNADSKIPRIPGDKTGDPPHFYRRCPSCQTAMIRRNIAKRSGVIVDFCQSHGVWFDGNELASFIQWVRHQGLDSAKPTKPQAQLGPSLLRSDPPKQPVRQVPPTPIARTSSGNFVLDAIKMVWEIFA